MVQFTYTAKFIISAARYPWLGNYRGRDTEEIDVYEKYQEWTDLQLIKGLFIPD